jgi:hypothetical protein
MINKISYKLVPFLVLIYFFVHFITDYWYFLEPENVVISVVKYFVTVAVSYFIGLRIFKNKEKLTLAFATILFLFLFFGSLSDTLESYNLIDTGERAFLKRSLVFFGCCVAIAILVFFLRNNITHKFLKAWIIYLLIVLAYDLVMFIVAEKKEKKYLTIERRIELNPSAAKPHVFFLLFDMYSSPEVYKKHFGFDNSAIDSFLTRKGFYVTHNAHSLYDATYFSLASTFDLQPLSFYRDSTVTRYKKPLLALLRTKNSVLLQAFQQAGYDIVNYSFFNLLGQPSILEFNLEQYSDDVLTGATFYNRIYNNVEIDLLRANRNIDLRFWKSSWSDDAKKDFATLDAGFKQQLQRCVNAAKPTFNYFHYMIPHPPVIYDSTGKENPVTEMYAYQGMKRSIEKYNSYTVYANRKIMKMVDAIFQQLGNNVIIIVQGDHGYREFGDQLPEEVRYGIFNSIYLPSGNYSGFSDSLNPIETFRLMLRNQFKTDYLKRM